MTLAAWLLIFGGWFALAFGLAVLVGKFIAHGERQEQRASRLELDGSWDDFLADCEARANRARWRHATRHGRGAA